MTSVFIYLFGLLAALVAVLVVLSRLIAKEKAQHAADTARHVQARRDRGGPANG
jgi:sensor domain CHASE-containing protein